MKKPPFVENQIYHIYNRGVEKRDIFLDDRDHLRFIHNLFELNDINAVSNIRQNLSATAPKSVEFVTPQSQVERYRKKQRDSLVEILVFTLMPNHYHLMVRQKTDGGIVKFMQKLGIAHTMYFNQKYDRVGPLFQGRFKAVLVEKDAHFLYLPYYIHFNPLDLIPKQTCGVRNSTSRGEKGGKMEFLEEYQWSSFPDYTGKRRKSPLLFIPSVTQRDFILHLFGNESKYRDDVGSWFKEKDIKDFDMMQEILLD